MASSNGYIQYLLRLVAAQGALVSVYTEPGDPDGFFAGYLEYVGIRHFLMAEVTPWGQMDGWRVRRTQDAFQILTGEEYEERLELLLAHYGHKHTAFFEDTLREDDDVLYRVLEKCGQEGRVVSIVVGEDMITGRVKDVNELRVRLSAMSFFGTDAGEEQITLREIDMLSVGSQEENMYETLERLSQEKALRLVRGQSEGAGGKTPGKNEDDED